MSFGLGFSALDKETSFKVLLQAAKNGNSSAQYALYYLVRNGVYKDYLDIKVSSKWLLVSAENGNQAAQEEVGLAYEIGDGFPKSKVRAHAWFNVAAIRNKEYIACRDRLEKGMSPKEISDAEQLAQEIFMSK